MTRAAASAHTAVSSSSPDLAITFCNDSANDVPLMEKVNHPVATNPDEALREIALARRWPILELFQ